jgi:hypothetical protein
MIVITFLNCKKSVIRIISGFSKHTSCRQIFKDYNILTVACLYILETVCYIKKYKDSLENVQFHNYNMQRKMDLHVQFCNTDLFKKSVVNMGIRLYNKVPDHIKDLEKYYFFKERVQILSVATCILLSGRIYIIPIACVVYMYVSLIIVYIYCFINIDVSILFYIILYWLYVD